ncbi:MFS transporter [Corynebacterium sp.]|uniref:MFS transporter n=1 Tax=Corynebacterium sp. TaxID=1720 RepID=UPI001986FC4F|nr:MFS transporter [Corynebacterium sp.]HHU66650.1 MFS transporter [Corynebacterium sp.]
MTRLDDVDSTPAQRWTFLFIISLGLLLVGVDNSILYTALPELREQLHTTEVQALWIINAYPLVLAGLMLGTGTLGDRIGHRLMFLVGLAVFGVASLAAAFAPGAWFLVAARAALGMGAATMMPATLALVRITFSDERERNTAIGVWGSVAVVGAALGPVLGGLLLEYFWWGSVFLINVPIAAAAIIATIAVAPPNMPDPTKRWDLVSSLWALLALSGLVTTIKELANPARTGWLLAGAAVVALVGSFLFTRRQQLLDDPLLTFDIFRSRIFTGGVLAAAGAMFAVVGLELMTTQRFQLVGGYSPLQAGLLVVSVTLAAFPFSILGGALLHRVGFQRLIAGGFLAITVGMGGAAWAGFHEQIPLFVAALALIGAGAGSIMSVSSTAIIGAAPVRRAGMAASVENVSYEFGTLVSVAVLGSLLPLLYARRVPGGLDLSGPIDGAAYDLAYLSIVILLAVVAGAFTLLTACCFRGNPRSPREAQ